MAQHSLRAKLQTDRIHIDGAARLEFFGAFEQAPAANPGLTRHGYTGHQHHNTGAGDIGLIYMNARYYLPDIGRFASPDIFVMDPANPASLNRYSYVGNNPLLYTDPDGHCWPLCTAIAGAVIGGLIGGAVQAVHNIRHDMPLTADVGKAFTVGAVAGAIGGATFGAGTAVLGTGFTATVVSGAISGAVAGQASVATGNTLNNQPLTQDLGNPHDLVRDAVIGGVLVSVSYGISKGFQTLSTRTSTSPGSGNALVLYDPEYASRVLLKQNYPGTESYAITPGGRTISAHAAERIAHGGPGRLPASLEAVDEILSTGTQVRFDPIRNTIQIRATHLSGRPFVVVSGDDPNHIVTVMVPK